MFSNLTGGKFFGILFGGAVALTVASNISPQLGMFLAFGYMILGIITIAKRGEHLGYKGAAFAAPYLIVAFLSIGFPVLAFINLGIILFLTFKNKKVVKA